MNVSATANATGTALDFLYGGLNSTKFPDTVRTFLKSGGTGAASRYLTRGAMFFDAVQFGRAFYNKDAGAAISSGASFATPLIGKALSGRLLSSLALTGSNAGLSAPARFGGPLVVVTVGLGQILITEETIRTENAIDLMDRTGMEASRLEFRLILTKAFKKLADLQRQMEELHCGN